MNKITTDIQCNCRINDEPVLRLVAGNDFTMRISMTKTQGDSTVPYDLSNAEDLVVNAVALDGTTIELDSFIEDTNHIIASVDAQHFDMYVKYSIEVIWRDEPYDKRACTSDVFMWVATQQEANQAQNEIISGPYDYELEIINDIAYVMIGTIPSTEGAVTYAQLEQELSYYATISYVQEAISYVEVDMSDYYNKTEIDTTLASYATQTYVTEAISNIPDTDLSDYYTKSEIDTTLSSYVTSSDLDTTLGSYVTYTDWDTNNQSVSYDLGYLDDRVTYIEQNGGGGGSVPSDVVTCYDASYIYMLTQSEYDTLEQNQQLDSDTFYYISDTTSNYVTKSEMNTAINNAIAGVTIDETNLVHKSDTETITGCKVFKANDTPLKTGHGSTTDIDTLLNADMLYGIHKGAMEVRPTLLQGVLGEVILPNRTVTNSACNINTEADKLKFYTMPSIENNSKPVLTQVAAIDSNGIYEGSTLLANKYVQSTTVRTIVQLSQNDYDDLVNNSSVDPNTMYIIV